MNKSKTAFLFPGQGVQTVGMAKELCENISECKAILDKSEEILDMPIKKLMFEGPEELLTATENAQPTILVASLIALKALEINGISADYTAGLSLGEYSSLIYGGALSLEDGLLLVKERGRIMGSALPEGLGTMAAILKLNDEKLKELLDRAGKFGIIEGANFNCPGQVSVSGENKAVEEAVKIAKELGGLGIPLKVSGPFHSSLLAQASEEFYNTIKTANIGEVNKIVYSNVKGLPYDKNDDIKDLLKRHIRSSVLFEKTINHMIDSGVDTFIEVGPGKALRGFVKKINKSANLLNVEDMQSLDNTINKLKA
ncbi:ACP S-malonyltransferase [Clostridium saccharobutylicum]|uniref:Malonyl CoA-acyl carrier protein transacylase n=1 Tax=Clostridium saccharobutylicum DSM 13864 TaxID=1345695 RepID=U5MNC7_CLOSA|nr:ACP S-malonyltransferase [Clostridium saccharobutylicum]AGX42314.1 malonyl CoA-acyl carrier protein transacylase FabD [Clostridium saccharobutylicum DSM 13864]AQR89595.1 malonyl CoA-acyl carrier protein transacylase [Clostridium saccharobutylicum]AQR99497.1 malonyl CoA-acyl carrier protein transacylase [Clostridium saccharobutylicum]AQS13483.1 malonyl CoA-acyl carrier protein transacylase [Clostridium saccharobutylicum]MBA2904327.1 [acyl-carrier-protein] S-malonyltransferase [Clostridium sa